MWSEDNQTDKAKCFINPVSFSTGFSRLQKMIFQNVMLMYSVLKRLVFTVHLKIRNQCIVESGTRRICKSS